MVKLRILVTGASGFIGKALVSHLTSREHEVIPFVEGQNVNGFDAVIHLAGEPLIAARWTREKRTKILLSRSLGTHSLCTALSQVSHPPKLFLSASAIGYYGDRGEELLTETSLGGHSFLSEVCSAWEEASAPLKNTATRLVQARFGIVLSAEGGALKPLILPAKLGLGTILGTGKQWMSWIARTDLIRAIEHILHTPSIYGPINLVAPTAVRQKEFTETLSQQFHRQVYLHIPAWLVKLLLGQMGEEMSLFSAHVVPEKLLASGFKFKHPTLSQAIQHCFEPPVKTAVLER